MIRRSLTSPPTRAPRARSALLRLTVAATTVGTFAFASGNAGAAAPQPALAADVIAFETVQTEFGTLRVPTATTQQNVIILTNQHRAKAGAPALRYNMALTIAAQRHANDMAKMNRLTHTGSDGSSPGTRMRKAGFAWTRCAENAAAGQTSSTQVVQAWMNSSGHRVNMLNPAYRYVGIGLAYGNGRIWWVMDLGV